MLRRILKAQNLMDCACRKLGRQLNIMEVCGTHTVSIFRNGIRPTLPKSLKLLSGPGCPVCVTDQGYIDVTVELAKRDDVILATYGDMIRVPGKSGSLEQLNRSNVKVVMSSDEALNLARENKDKTVVFVAVGFETTTPATAVAVGQAADENLENFTVLSGHKLVIPAMKALLTDKNNKIDAFLCPGHVSVIIGSDAYKTVLDDFDVPCVVAGFEPMQVIEGIGEICRQIYKDDIKVESIYHAAVKPEGNPTAQKIIDQYFEAFDGPWRGLGNIPGGTLRLKEEYAQFDAFKRFGIDQVPTEELNGCKCGEVLCGLIDPPQCPKFENTCTPDTPIGPCMVSSEGACSAWYKYGRRRRRRRKQA
ncbi:Hydrogenase isoenzymes formation protein HypD [Anaerohalosphaera lusitana]|uniref:Hydrogenase isoenzymes formation protein HypD n=1 Tax=Anaerohalosphaera lusitana TaxID=1936003 RepID=A0A1U9NHY2_9BACT|nr:hydrogenase formation protein HypD [Anaerohalosphaera lusitana]AQT67543.1 Hydrogenase isoenzymes formation protein HypD [Anaerohalosphaera lusitana]